MLFHSPAFIFGLPAALLPGLRPGLPPVGLAAGAALAGRGLAGVLRPMGLGARRPAAGLDPVQFRRRAADARPGSTARRRTGRILCGAIAANLALLGCFKYTNFLIDNVNLIAGSSLPHLAHHAAGRDLVLYLHPDRLPGRGLQPPGRRGQVRPLSAVRLVLPLRHRRPDHPAAGRCCRSSPRRGPALLDGARVATALTVFGIGLCKKLLLADHIAPFANAVFGGAAGVPRRRRARLDRRARLHAAALFRLLRLFRHGARHRLPVRAPAAAQLQLAAQGLQHHRFLAALAHHHDALLHQLSLRADRAADDAPRAAAAPTAAGPASSPRPRRRSSRPSCSPGCGTAPAGPSSCSA